MKRELTCLIVVWIKRYTGWQLNVCFTRLLDRFRWLSVDIVVVVVAWSVRFPRKRRLLTIRNEMCCRPIRRERVRSTSNVPPSKRHTRAPQVGRGHHRRHWFKCDTGRRRTRAYILFRIMKQRVAAAAIILGPSIQGGLYETKVKTSTRAEEMYDVDDGFFFFFLMNICKCT